VKLTRPSDVRSLLAEIGVRPSRVSGQNFLADANVLRILIETASLSPDDTVLEIGPGLGTVTERLLEAGCRVIAVEKDSRLSHHLEQRFRDSTRFRLIGADALDLDPATLNGLGFDKVVANLPYSVGSRILVNLFRMPHPPRKIVVTVQREVAERLAAGPGSRTYGLLSVWAQQGYAVRVRRKVSPTCFHPVPRVWSAIVEMNPIGRTGIPLEDETLFRELTKRAFGHRRKQMATLLNRLAPPMRLPPRDWAAWLNALGFNPQSRPENLSAEDWCRLSNALRRAVPQRDRPDSVAHP
jgi:16S rRNA (adenine1518-N6/adenine1519-N6)-dimethyltransferase